MHIADRLTNNLLFPKYTYLILETSIMNTEQELGINSTEDLVVKPLTRKEKLKKAFKEYGSTVIVLQIIMSLISLGSFYLLLKSGVDLVALLKYFNIGEGIVAKAVGSNAGTFVLAYAIHKIFAPVRMGLVLAATPFIVRYLRKIGFLKSPELTTISTDDK